MNPMETLENLVSIMDRLREPSGCPWDREQTYGTLRAYLLEECYEVVEALDTMDPGALREELGDLLFQIVFLSRLAKEEGHFTTADVVRGVAEKMVRRHPHIFGDDRADTSEEVLRNWEEIKRKERNDGSTSRNSDTGHSILSGIPLALPALLKAQRLGAKAARVGFDWRKDADLFEKLKEETEELRSAFEAGDPVAVREELGDLLFTVAMMGRRLEVDPEGALEQANRKFRERFGKVEGELRRRGIRLEEAGLELMDSLWNETKR